jgi:hypothetical protein
MSPRERAEYNYEHMKVGDLVRHWDGNIGIVLEIDPVEAKIKWIKDPKGETLWQMLYNLETLCDMSTLVG